MSSSAKSADPRPYSRASALVVAAALVVLAVLSGMRCGRPAVLPESAPETVFASARAMKHLSAIASRPRRAGSRANEEVRAHIVGAMTSLGLEVSVQHATVLQPRYSKPSAGMPARIGDVDNVVARMKGADDNAHGSVIFMAHYDSVGPSPGASDDGAGTVTLLEAARALEAGPPLAHDVVFVFTDDEEEGLLGAKAFVEEHPLAKDARVVLNFEGRGDRGGVLMFQTSDGNGALVRELARSVAVPYSSSLLRDAYRRMPNDSDLTEWLLQTNAQGMNFANIEGLGRYHAPTDDVPHFDERILAESGAYAVAFARDLAGGDLDLPREPDATFFDVGPFFVRYPETYSPALAGAAAVSAIFFALSVVKKQRARPTAMLTGAIASFAAVALSALLAAGVSSLLDKTHPAGSLIAIANPAIGAFYTYGFAAIGALVMLVVCVAASRRVQLAEHAAGTALAWAVLAIAFAIYLPAGAYLVTWPLLATTLAWTGLTWSSPAGLANDRPLALAAQVIACAPVLLFFVPLSGVLVDAFGPRGTPAIAIVAASVMSLMLPALYYLLVAGRGAAPLAALAAMIVAFVAAHAVPCFDAMNPRPDTLFFAVDHDTSKSYWVTTDAALDPFTERFLAGATKSALPPFAPTHPTTPVLHREVVPYVDAAAIDAVVTADDRADAPRTLTIHFTPAADTEAALVVIDASAKAARATVQGKDVDEQPDGSIAFAYTAPPKSGFDVVLAFDPGGGAKVRARVVTQTSGLPAIGAEALRTRPRDLMPRPQVLPPYDELELSDMTVVARSFEF